MIKYMPVRQGELSEYAEGFIPNTVEEAIAKAENEFEVGGVVEIYRMELTKIMTIKLGLKAEEVKTKEK